jgi:hypothetical protein
MWRHIGPPLRGPVPVALAALAAIVVAPAVVVLPICAQLGAWKAPHRARIAWGRFLEAPTGPRWVAVRWALVVALLATYAVHGTSRWPLP